jgi:hypothetical protein
VLGVGLGTATLPNYGGTLLVNSISLAKTYLTGGVAGAGGASAAAIPFLANDPSVVGGAAEGIALTNGSKVVIG